MEERFINLNSLIYESYMSKDLLKVQELLLEYQNIAVQYKGHWNYGNAIHVSNIFLGLIAVEENNIAKAKEYLINSGLIKGSPQINSFGPNMILAKVLLEKGETEVVLKYIDLSKKYWNFFVRFFYLRKWKKKIRNNQNPNFRSHLIYHLNSPKLIDINSLLLRTQHLNGN